MRCSLSVIREYAVSLFSAWHQPPGPFQQGKMSIKTDASFGVGAMQSLKPATTASSSPLSKEKKIRLVPACEYVVRNNGIAETKKQLKSVVSRYFQVKQSL